ncbi:MULTISPECIES: DUF6453 family protein [Yersinia pseudotuberculosis complex]|uniref:DUF6453 family protein n=1 Tax=Yersinia pseudotuberculosis complex TaxID=1649845 RepID=UPI00119E9B04|nr:DUF6453 family protein [Yersinia similis]
MGFYGLQIRPNDGGSAINITSGARAASYLGEFTPSFLNDEGSSVVQVPNVTPGAQMFVLPISTAIVYQSPGSAVASTLAARSISINGSIVHTQLRNFNPYYDKGRRPVKFRCMQVMSASSAGGNYGLALYDATNYAEINDASISGACVYRGIVQVAPNWQVPGDVPFRESCTVFAHWDSGDITLDFDETTKTISGWRRGGTIGVNQVDINITAYICIFSNGAPQIPPRYGLAIWNRAGQCTFSSDSAPLLLRGTVGIQYVPGYYSAAPAGIGRMMVPLCRLGVHELRSSTNVMNYFAGMRMSGNAVTAFLGRLNTNYIATDYWIDFAITTLPLPVIDANDYF